ncbi:Transcriptional regulator, XRE family [Sphingobium herbicidovorans NBRC 16415]|uniref:Transcriptional regulator, XRE family n=1 Tax=Sphingobium herbicidovorans (strain ATCC 700291 / DSM 11019 / CCUG 56400 / KCTC 2939 / LMG 18315 / NBRC 16415 / MH) TaxID=1219045 RepID=A0A086P682_SPHHM|nr:helix-turn-helix transcriptional regulator [Sphingobium herbicidovorans]KFG88900.1 Transcriptional regulator, XRE family [Sphingobium herbicidovorans NBRC 16415]
MAKTRRPGIATILLELRRELKGRGIRVATLAEQMGVAEPTIWRWLRGEGLTLDRLDEICAVADLDLRDLISRGDDQQQERFTLAQERVLAADRGLALVFFAILHGAQRRDLEEEFGLPADRLDSHLERLERLGLIEAPVRGRIRSKMRRAVRWRRGGPLSVSFERTVKPLFMSMDFGSPDARYVSDMVSLSDAGRARVQALFEAMRDDIHVIGEQEEAARLEGREWSGVLMMVRPFDIGELTSEWRGKGARPAPAD